MSCRTVRFAALTASLALASLAQAEGPVPATPTAASPEASPARGAQRVVFDRKTADAGSRTDVSTPAAKLEPLVVEPIPGRRGIKMNLQGRLRAVVVATVQPDGTLRTACVKPGPEIAVEDCPEEASDEKR